MMHPAPGIALVLGLLLALLKGVRCYQRRRPLHPEVARKLLHVGLGLTALALPWLFDEAWPRLLLAGLATPGLWLFKRSAWLRGHFGGVIDGVARRSCGELCFPAGVLAALLLAGDAPALYCGAIALLTLADAAAALVGTRYGRHAYATWGGGKTVEGSWAFFLVALACLLSLLACSFGRAGLALLLQSLALALALTLVEACSGWGSDNLSIPLATLLLLPATLPLDVLRLGMLCCLLLALTLICSRFQLSTSNFQAARGGLSRLRRVAWFSVHVHRIARLKSWNGRSRRQVSRKRAPRAGVPTDQYLKISS